MDGKFNFDIPGTLSGNWWLKDTDSYFADDEYGRRQLAFAYDNIYQDEISISIGKNLDDILESNILRVFYVQSDAVPPERSSLGRRWLIIYTSIDINIYPRFPTPVWD